MSTSTVSSTTIDKKRKRDARDEGKSKKQQPEGSPQLEEESSKKKKKRRRNKQISENVNDDGKKDGIDESIGKMDRRLLADFFAQQAKRNNEELTAVELSDIYIPGRLESLRFAFCLQWPPWL
jgi:protein CMS1